MLLSRYRFQFSVLYFSTLFVFTKLGIALNAFGWKWTIRFVDMFKKGIVEIRNIRRCLQVAIIVIVLFIAFSMLDLLPSSNLVLIFLVESFFQIRCISRPFRRILKGAPRSFRCSVQILLTVFMLVFAVFADSKSALVVRQKCVHTMMNLITNPDNKNFIAICICVMLW